MMASNGSAKDKQIIIVLSEFNKEIIERLLIGATDSFLQFGGVESNLKVFRVPGAFEIPGTINQILKNQKAHAIIALGAVIKGETPHFDFVAGESAKGLSTISRKNNIPIINGILTTDNVEQATERSVPGGRNKGWEAMEAALKTVSVYNEIQSTF